MAKKQSVHLKLDSDLHAKLWQYSKARNTSNNAIVTKAVEEFFNQESVHPVRHNALKQELEYRFLMPSGYTVKSFWITLYMLGVKYGRASSKAYWGDMVFLGIEDKTHAEVCNEIRESVEKRINRAV